MSSSVMPGASSVSAISSSGRKSPLPAPRWITRSGARAFSLTADRSAPDSLSSSEALRPDFRTALSFAGRPLSSRSVTKLPSLCTTVNRSLREAPEAAFPLREETEAAPVRRLPSGSQPPDASAGTLSGGSEGSCPLSCTKMTSAGVRAFFFAARFRSCFPLNRSVVKSGFSFFSGASEPSAGLSLRRTEKNTGDTVISSASSARRCAFCARSASILALRISRSASLRSLLSSLSSSLLARCCSKAPRPLRPVSTKSDFCVRSAPRMNRAMNRTM